MNYFYLGVTPLSYRDWSKDNRYGDVDENAAAFNSYLVAFRRNALLEAADVIRIWQSISRNEFVSVCDEMNTQWVKKCNEAGVPVSLSELQKMILKTANATVNVS